jgi:hypothetical protein
MAFSALRNHGGHNHGLAAHAKVQAAAIANTKRNTGGTLSYSHPLPGRPTIEPRSLDFSGPDSSKELGRQSEADIPVPVPTGANKRPALGTDRPGHAGGLPDFGMFNDYLVQALEKMEATRNAAATPIAVQPELVYLATSTPVLSPYSTQGLQTPRPGQGVSPSLRVVFWLFQIVLARFH